MRTITATEFKAKCLKLLDEVQRTGEELLVSKGFREIFIVEDICAAPYWGQSFRIDFLICQLEDINPKGLTLIT